MSDNAEFLLGKSQESIEGIREIYAAVAPDAVLSDELYYLIRNAIQDQLSALDMTANAAHVAYGKPYKSGWSPYYPIVSDPADFDKRFDENLKGVRVAKPEIAKAFKRHQPFINGKEDLKHIHTLARVNKHRGFSAHVRKDSRLTLMLINGSVIMAGGSFGMTIGGPPPEYVTGQIVKAQSRSSENQDVGMILAEVVDWEFTDPQVPVLRTLMRLQNIITEAVTDIHHVASL